MAKTTSPKKTPKKPAKTPKKPTLPLQKTASPTPKAALSEPEQATLLALADNFERPIDTSVSDVLQEARELEAVVEEHGAELEKKSDLAPALRDALAPRRKILETCEGAWFSLRMLLTPEEKLALRQEAETLKRDAVAALRFFLRTSQEVQRKVSAIQEGSGLADLLDDLSKLADLLEEHQTTLAKADLPEERTAAQAALRARALAETLGATVASEKTNQENARALTLRNRAFWHLREAMDEIRVAGRYVFRKQPKLLPLFRATRSPS